MDASWVVIIRELGRRVANLEALASWCQEPGQTHDWREQITECSKCGAIRAVGPEREPGAQS